MGLTSWRFVLVEWWDPLRAVSTARMITSCHVLNYWDTNAMPTFYLQPSDSRRFSHRTGGLGDDLVPCPLCRRPLSAMMVYDLSDRRLELGDWKRSSLPCYYCMRCDLWEVQYRVHPTRIEILMSEGTDDENFVGDAPIVPLELNPVPLPILAILNADDINNGLFQSWYRETFGFQSAQPFPHVGDLVYILRGGKPKICVSCKRPMKRFAALYDSALVKFDYLNVDCQYVFSICQDCRVVHGAIHT